MNFAYPEFLFALTAVSIPIVIHLFNFRRFKKVYFSDIRFLKNVEIETRSKNQLRNLLILLTRMLAITCLVLGFAQPVIPTSNSQQSSASKNVIVYVDNSFSMNAAGENGSLLQEAIAKSIEVASAYSGSASLKLLTNDFAAQHNRNLTIEEFKSEAAAMHPSPQARNLEDIIARALSATDSTDAVSLYIISDLQKHQSLSDLTLSNYKSNIYILPVQSKIESNIYIDSCWFESPVRLPEQADALQVRIKNAGENEVENLSVRLLINGIQRSVSTATIGAENFEVVELPFTNAKTGLQLAKVELDDYPITYDNSYNLS
ncbi:BatA domain-containing protein, partial [Bacteroidota bacterium]